MCDPITAIAVTTAVAGGIQAYGQYQAGKDQQRIENMNARLLDEQALDAQRRGDIEEQEHRNKVRAMLGAQRAAFGANNVVSNSGSPLALQLDTTRFGELDALTIRNNAAREAYGYRSEAKIGRARGKAAKKSGTMGALGTVLGSGAQAYGIWKKAA
jgi:hypothetical protein